MEQIGGLYRLVATITCLVCLGFNVGMCLESDALIVASSLRSNDDVDLSAKLKVNKISDSEWDSLVIKSDLPVMVSFTAKWCSICRFISPILENLDSDFMGRFKFYTMDIDEETVIPAIYGIRTVPISIVFKGGYQMANAVGADRAKLYKLVEEYV